MIQKSPDGAEGDDAKVYFFFTEVSVEYEFVFKLMIPRVARVCKVSALPSPQAQFPPIVPDRFRDSCLWDCSDVLWMETPCDTV